MNNKITFAVALIIVALGAGLVASRHSQTSELRSTQSFGALGGPDIQSPYLAVNGVKTEFRSTSLTLATTTPCALQSPAATSTLIAASLTVSVASSTATTWTLAKATTAFATTTYLDVFSLGSGVQGTLFSSATTTGVDIKQVVAPSTWIVWGKAGDTPAGTGLGGVCKAEFLVTSA